MRLPQCPLTRSSSNLKFTAESTFNRDTYPPFVADIILSPYHLFTIDHFATRTPKIFKYDGCFAQARTVPASFLGF
jgi:hypothetical protein